MIESNPFEGIAASVRANPSRFYFISMDDAQTVLDHCPDAQWRVIFALARYGGLRCPSEVMAVTWADVNWERGRIRIPSPKTEHHEGGESRIIPLFAELRPYLMEAFEEADPGTEHVVTRYRDSNANLRTQLHRIIGRAGLELWPKPFQNLRSTRETELAESYPMHVVCKWIGNSRSVAVTHYLQLTDEHFDHAVQGADPKAAQNAAQKLHDVSGNEPKRKRPEVSEGVTDSAHSRAVPLDSGPFKNREIAPAGFEPATERL
ncbi:MAG: hypothetical protein CMJ49_06345 [Planctomycetaceae bacterium]|nr:hypothetical protein [Planctomycetaceae bacterium]